jgi:hypothetical protein
LRGLVMPVMIAAKDRCAWSRGKAGSAARRRSAECFALRIQARARMRTACGWSLPTARTLL